MPELNKQCHFTCPIELYNLVDKKSRSKTLSQTMRELMAEYVGRRDLANTRTTSDKTVRKYKRQAEIAIYKIQNGISTGWKELCYVIHDMAESNLIAMAENYLRTIRLAYGHKQPGRRAAKLIDETAMFVASKATQLSQENDRIWMEGPPSTPGHFMVIRDGELSYEYANELNCVPLNDRSIDWYVRINPPPCQIDSVRTASNDPPPPPDPLGSLSQMILDPLQDQSAGSRTP